MTTEMIKLMDSPTMKKFSRICYQCRMKALKKEKQVNANVSEELTEDMYQKFLNDRKMIDENTPHIKAQRKAALEEVRESIKKKSAEIHKRKDDWLKKKGYKKKTIPPDYHNEKEADDSLGNIIFGR